MIWLRNEYIYILNEISDWQALRRLIWNIGALIWWMILSSLREELLLLFWWFRQLLEIDFPSLHNIIWCFDWIWILSGLIKEVIRSQVSLWAMLLLFIIILIIAIMSARNNLIRHHLPELKLFQFMVYLMLANISPRIFLNMLILMMQLCL